MSITAMANARITVLRRTPYIIDEADLTAAPGSTAPVRLPPAPHHVEAKVVGAGGGGTLTVNGTVDGLPVAEVLTFTGPGARTTVNRFDEGSVTSIDHAGWGGGQTYGAYAVGPDGSRIHSSYQVASGWPAKFDRARAKWPHPAAGSQAEEQTRFYVDYTTAWGPERGDVIIDERTGDEWKVRGKPPLHGRSLIPHHWEIEVEEVPGASST